MTSVWPFFLNKMNILNLALLTFKLHCIQMYWISWSFCFLWVCVCEREKRDLPSGLTPCTLWSQPHFSSSPLLQALVTANATLAAEMAYTKAASRVPNTHTNTGTHSRIVSFCNRKELLICNGKKSSTDEDCVKVSGRGAPTLTYRSWLSQYKWKPALKCQNVLERNGIIHIL